MPRTTFLAAAAAAAFLAAAAAAASARADLVQLKDGRFVEGVDMRVENGAVVLAYTNGEVRLPMDLVEDYVIDGATPAAAAGESDETKEKRAGGLVLFRGKWMKPEARDKAVRDETAKRLAQLEQEKAHQEWRNRRKFETKNFAFESTVPEDVGRRYAEVFDAYFEEMRKRWGLKVPKDWGKLKVCLYRDRKAFNQVSGGRGGTLAYYRFVAPRELNCYYDRLDPDGSVATALHEITHYVVDLVDEDSNYPHWINEAVAEYYGAAKVDPKNRTVTLGGLQEGRLQEVKTDLLSSKKIRLQDLIGSEGGDYEHYYWGWSFVHFMLETPAYAKKFQQYFFDLGRAKDVERTLGAFNLRKVSGNECLRVFLKRMGLDRLDGLEQEWYAYLEKLQPTGVTGLEEAGEAAFRQGRWKFRAPRQLKAAIDGGSRKPNVYVLYAMCVQRKGPEAQEEALGILDQGLKVCDPLCADLYAHKGFLLYAMGKKDEGRKLVELAREMNPDEPYLELEIAEAFAGGPGEE